MINGTVPKKEKSSIGGDAFLIHVHHRQNATWQGSVQWLEGQKTKPFRSLLELITLMQEALQQSGKSEVPTSSAWLKSEEVL